MYAPTPDCEGGIWAESYQIRLTYIKKLFSGLIKESIPEMSVVATVSGLLWHAASSKTEKRIGIIFIYIIEVSCYCEKTFRSSDLIDGVKFIGKFDLPTEIDYS